MQLVKSSSSILRKFLIFNSLIFLILGLFTFFYLKSLGIIPNEKLDEKFIINKAKKSNIENIISFFIIVFFY